MNRPSGRQEHWLVQRHVNAIIIVVSLTDISVTAVAREDTAQFAGHAGDEALRL